MPTDHLTATVRAKSPLDAILLEAGLSGKWLAEMMAVNTGTVSRWRNGLRPAEIQRETIVRILNKALDRQTTVEALWP